MLASSSEYGRARKPRIVSSYWLSPTFSGSWSVQAGDNQPEYFADAREAWDRVVESVHRRRMFIKIINTPK